MNNNSIRIFMVLLFVAAMCTQAKVCAQNKLEGRQLAIVTTSKGKAIYLTERQKNGAYSVAAFTKNNGKYVEEKVFKVNNNLLSVINSVKYKKWFSSNPKGTYFAFNPADKTLYVPLIDDNMEGGDRYIVYRFDGQHFVYKCKDGGFWLHNSLRSFKKCINVGKTKDYLIRVDELENGAYRYASWKHKTDWANQSKSPDLIISDGFLHTPMMADDDCQYRFRNKGYLYLCFGAYDGLVVYKTSNYAQVLNQPFLEVLNKNEGYPCD